MAHVERGWKLVAEASAVLERKGVVGDGKHNDALDFVICDVVLCWLSQLGASSFPLPIASSLPFVADLDSPPSITTPSLLLPASQSLLDACRIPTIPSRLKFLARLPSSVHIQVTQLTSPSPSAVHHAHSHRSLKHRQRSRCERPITFRPMSASPSLGAPRSTSLRRL
ncbi:hypothetical protein FA13DRAFT_1176036 [Coprinellus micaceus]|uniref:Uncharacterized protein n=1 Tax=Coprinellus micaceus TaxID=71717 RepID=A0A4Y7SUH8_COPMI|nr:hypothetical protein FA13DRAFT_1176036 [Coprinellus micaceus]